MLQTRPDNVGTIYHIVSRGVDKRKIFLDEQDHFRAVHDLFEFNDTQQLSNSTYYFKNNPLVPNLGLRKTEDVSSVLRRPNIRRPRILLVDLMAFCLMPNHYHFLIRPRSPGAITIFMKRFNMGYAKYFNEKYKRTGALFEGRYRRIEIVEESHFVHVPYYIHCNPLDADFHGWRERILPDHNGAVNFLDSYRWSSHRDYAGIPTFPSVTQREFLLSCFGGTEGYKESMKEWLESMKLNEGGKGPFLE